MKKTLMMIAIALFALVGTTSCGSYGKNRWNDCKDVVTVGFGLGLGVQPRVSCLETGLFYNREYMGLREGVAHIYGPETNALDLDLLLYRGGNFTPHYDPETELNRLKTTGGYTGIAIFGWPVAEKPAFNFHYLGQVELAAGLGLSARLGANPIELVDLIIGLTTLDFMSDDVAVNAEEEEGDDQAQP